MTHPDRIDLRLVEKSGFVEQKGGADAPLDFNWIHRIRRDRGHYLQSCFCGCRRSIHYSNCHVRGSHQPPPPDVENRPDSAYGLTPFELAHLAYFGYFYAQGLSSYTTLLNNYQTGDLTSQDVVRAGVFSDRLQARALIDDDYISRVGHRLDQLNLNHAR